MIAELAHYSGRIAKIDGPGRSGKTEVLIRRCATLLEQGADAESILVVASSELACVRFRQRLASAVGENLREEASRITVSRALDVCISILDEPAAREATGRVPRILNESEYPFFIEDLKTLGQKNQRLHSMLSFFYAQWSEFKDEEEWLIPGEETTVLDYARCVLGAYGAMLRHEAPYLCGKLLLSDAGKPLAQRYDYVFCDDFQNLSYAEQTCLCLCARKQVMICGNAAHTTQVNTEYPSVKGYGRFERARKNVDVFALEEAYGIERALQFEEALCEAGGEKHEPTPNATEPANAGTLFVEWATPEDELANLGRIIESFEGRTPGARRSDIIIAVPNKRWGKLVKAALAQQGIDCSAAGLDPSLGGDPRTPGRHDALTAYAKLCLVADPEDIVAWRILTGLDDALTNSEAWKSLHKNAQEGGASLMSALADAVMDATAGSTAVLKAEVLRKAWDSGQNAIARCHDLRGMDLAQALGLSESPEFSEVLAALTGDEDAEALCESVRNSLASPRFSKSPGSIHLALYENLCGLDCPCLIVLGMVDGLIPFRDALDDAIGEDKRKQVMDEDRRRLCTCISKGTTFLITSTFTKTDIETAERTKMKVARITSAREKRLALLKRSTFFTEAGTACPDFAEGNQVDFARLFTME